MTQQPLSEEMLQQRSRKDAEGFRVGSTTYGDKADPNAFYCGFINDVKEVSFQDGGKVEFTTSDSKSFPYV